jgi:nucleotidyltransferase/DNA polymerase involved in DNA repair
MGQPDGLTIIRDEDLPAVLHPLALQDVPGISSNMELRLKRCGIDSIAKLCAAPQAQLYEAWHSVMGRYMWHWLRGDDLCRRFQRIAARWDTRTYCRQGCALMTACEQ